MLPDLLVHTRTIRQIRQFLARPSHGLILTGDKGLGKHTLALAVAASLLNLDEIEALENYPYFTLVNPEDTGISIEQIRNLQKLLTLKTPIRGSQEIRRVIVIADAEKMRSEAQNAFLKSLEEPPADTCIILTAADSGKLLPTIYSRVQRIEVLPVGETMARAYFLDKGTAAADFKSSYALSQGQPGLLSALLHESEHELKEWVKTAKSLLSDTPQDRLLATDEISKDKLTISLLLNALQRIAHAALGAAANANKPELVERWVNNTAQIQFAVKAFSSNANAKLLLDNLLLNL